MTIVFPVFPLELYMKTKMLSSANFLRSKTTNKQFSVCKSGYPSIDWPLPLFPLSFAFFLWSTMIMCLSIHFYCLIRRVMEFAPVFARRIGGRCAGVEERLERGECERFPFYVRGFCSLAVVVASVSCRWTISWFYFSFLIPSLPLSSLAWFIDKCQSHCFLNY